jgi:hypothetical protein
MVRIVTRAFGRASAPATPFLALVLAFVAMGARWHP